MIGCGFVGVDGLKGCGWASESFEGSEKTPLPKFTSRAAIYGHPGKFIF